MPDVIATPPAILPTTRRARIRLETTAEIKERTWSLLARSGPSALSLREVARQMGMAPSALYRYFASRDDLLTELIVDGFNSLADALEQCYADSKRDGLSAADAFVAVCSAYRAWAFDNVPQYTLIFSTSIPDYTGPERTKISAMRSSDVLLQLMADLVAEDGLDEAKAAALVSDPLRGQLAGFRAMCAVPLSDEALVAAMWCYAALHGAIHLDMNNHLPPDLQHSTALFESTIRHAMTAIGRPQSNSTTSTSPAPG